MTGVGRHLMLGFEGTDIPRWLPRVMADDPPSGFTLSVLTNVESPAQLAELTARLELLNPTDEPLLIAGDQETGQLCGLGTATTPFAGNMALGATGDTGLAMRVAAAVATEMRAVGFTVNYAPVCDVVTRPDNPSLGIRSFGDDPAMVGRMAAATVVGFHGGGVIATAKHFPGKGDAAVDPHHELPILDMDLARLEAVEFPPFRAAIADDVGLVMVGHYGLPAVTGRPDLPASLSHDVIAGLLRSHLGFEGVVITDALDMGAVEQGGAVAVQALAAGVDLLLCSRDPSDHARIREALKVARNGGELPGSLLDRSARHVSAMRGRVSGAPRPDLAVLGSAGHLALADELARRSITVVRNDAGLLPLRLASDARVLAVMPAPRDLTPADTSSLVKPSLAQALRRYRSTTEIVTSHPPTDEEIAAAARTARSHDLVVVGTIDADERQADLVRALRGAGVAVVTASLRTPYDVVRYPETETHVCTYSIQEPSLRAFADALFGEAVPSGRLPVAVPGTFPAGHGLSLASAGGPP